MRYSVNNFFTHKRYFMIYLNKSNIGRMFHMKETRIRIKLKELLAERDMTQKDFAEKADIRPSAVSAMCKGNQERLYVDHLVKAIEVLELNDLNQLLEIVEIETTKKEV